MKLEKMELPIQNKVLHAYQHNKAFLHKYFDYGNDEDSYRQRIKELEKRCFQRKELANVIRTFMTPFGLSSAANKHIEELMQDDALTVIGGQQAGVLTGPLYSVHKAITVILHAREQRETLGIPVIPVFWVAGEDHDLHEINHVYSEVNGQVMKEQIQDKFVMKLMASDAQFDRDKMAVFVKGIFEKFGETSHTEECLTEVLDAIDKETTFTGFFVRLMNGFFAEEGLLFIDAAFEPLRALESEYFCKLIQASAEIASSIVEIEKQLQFDGFGVPIEAQEDAMNLFYVHETGRMLLSRKDGQFVNEGVGIQFTEEEILEIAKKQPILLSNNVASRPLMQELVFPVLAFVGGAGELAYWAVLKDAFHHLGLKMPIFVPRMSITLVSRQTEKVLKEKSLTVEEVMTGAATNEKKAYVDKLRDDNFIEEIDKLEKDLAMKYEHLSEWFGQEEKMMNQLLQQNLSFHIKQFNYLKHKYEDTLYEKHEVAIRKFDKMESELFPNGQLQERIYHPYVYLNQYGSSLIKDLLALPFENDGSHYVVYL
ncbi:bacillithiol biosynthesis cysteine-adding enzyme BshC [Sporosarcina ureilytica]|uniref:Putative cysteine ligase BshC n=1 Tax=Sporosarcina ureilytica TaxID=298596 RepID=A0A1D8JI08_9BACL|nr:bacillithiol biosynthesis cysteine-adding enzyme BshC [Sporosarcina ureilytica]AOV08352.1 bacillithiol biosynthesis cysteine-adding enzyme BshC [Sporosarcina ureilytica]